jgi:hypothetical protein
MFAFDLPRHAAIKVELPTGGEAIMIHVGGGRFVTNMPPLVLAGVSAVEGEEVTGLPMDWDSGALPHDLHSAFFAFDTIGAARAVEVAAAAGDVSAQGVLTRMRDAEKMLAAREAVGMVKAPEVVQ